MQTLFVTGTDTNVGKTFVSCLLIRKLRTTGLTVGAYKPACSGAELNSAGETVWSDVEALRSAMGDEYPLDLICPQRFHAAVAPNVAADLEGVAVSNEMLRTGFAAWTEKTDALIIEGAGGIFCPLSNDLTVLDLATEIGAPVVVVAANRLGVISHTRLTVERLRQNGLHVAAIVLNEVHASESTDSSLMTNAGQLAHWIPNIALLKVAHGSEIMTVLEHDQELTNQLLKRAVQ